MPKNGFFPVGIPFIRIAFTIANPAAGAQFTQIVPNGKLWLIRSVSYELVNGPAVANRLPGIIFDDGATRIYESFMGAFQLAGVTARYFWSIGSIHPDTNVPNRYMPIFPMLLPQGCRIRSDVQALQAADQINIGPINIEEYIVNNP